jgi:hypothetical protein
MSGFVGSGAKRLRQEREGPFVVSVGMALPNASSLMNA